MNKKRARDAEETWPIRHVSDASELNEWDYLAGNMPPVNSPEYQRARGIVESAERNGLESFISPSDNDESGRYIDKHQRKSLGKAGRILFIIFATFYAPVILFVTKKGSDGKRRIALNKVSSWVWLAIWTFCLLGILARIIFLVS